MPRLNKLTRNDLGKTMVIRLYNRPYKENNNGFEVGYDSAILKGEIIEILEDSLILERRQFGSLDSNKLERIHFHFDKEIINYTIS